jgi:hypothetical protein
LALVAVLGRTLVGRAPFDAAARVAERQPGADCGPALAALRIDGAVWSHRRSHPLARMAALNRSGISLIGAFRFQSGSRVAASGLSLWRRSPMTKAFFSPGDMISRRDPDGLAEYKRVTFVPSLLAPSSLCA